MFGSVFLKDEEARKGLDDLGKKGETVTSKLGKTFGGLGGTLMKVGGILGAGMGMKEMISGAMEAQNVEAQLEAVIKSTGGAAGVTKEAALGLADALEKTTKFSGESVVEAENLMLTFTNVGKDVFPQATKTMLDMATALGTDASGGAIQLGKALNDPVAGISALSRVGVTFTEDQKAVIKSLVDTGDIAGAQKVILAELNKEFGGSAEAAGKTFAGQLEIAKNALGNVGDTIGMALIPYLTQFLQWVQANMPAIQAFIETAMTKVTQVFDFLGKNVIPPLLIVLDGVKAVLKFIGDNANWLIPIVGGLTTGIITYNAVMTAMELKTKLVTAAQAAWNAVMALNPIGLVVAAIMGLIAVIVLLVKNWDEVSAFITKSWNALKTLAKTVWEGIKNIISGVVDGIKTKLSTTWEAIKTGVSTAFNGVKTIITNIWNGISGTIKGSVNFIIGAINGFIRGMNKISFKAPDWVPGIGGRSFGISIPLIPKLEKGGIVTDSIFANIGEGKYNEAVLPLNKRTYGEIAKGIAAAGAGVVVNVSLDGATFRSKEDIDYLAQQFQLKTQQALRGAGIR